MPIFEGGVILMQQPTLKSKDYQKKQKPVYKMSFIPFVE